MENILNPFPASSLLICYQGYAYIIIRLKAFLMKRLNGIKRSHHVLLVVLNSPSVNFSFFHPGLEWIPSPLSQFSRRNNVHMRHYPYCLGRAFPFEKAENIRAISRGSIKIRCLDNLNIAKSVFL